MRVPSDRPIDSEFESLRAQIWQQLRQAIGEREHEWRTPVLADVDAEGLPQARTVVLRQADPIAGTLQSVLTLLYCASYLVGGSSDDR